MNCEFNEKYELGKLAQEAYSKHAATCKICQSILEKDEKLLELSGKLKQPILAPNLWGNIEHNLQQEKEKQFPWIIRLRKNKTQIYALAAVLIAAIGLSFYFSLATSDKSSGRLLTKTLLEEVRETELAYEDAITELEETAQNKLTGMDVELMLLYRDRLETIETQIARCKNALIENPANAHIRRYLLAALQDKKETLTEIFDFEIQQL